MNAEDFYIINYRSKFNPCFKENRKIEQFTFDDMIEFAERYNEAQQQANGDEQSSSNCNIPRVSNLFVWLF